MTITSPAVPHPFSYRLYRTIWTCTLVMNISVWMQNVAAAWLMTSLTSSPVMVALIQTATTLPAFLFCLPAGVLADQLDRRRLLIASHAWMLFTSVLLCLLLWLGLMSPLLLLAATFMLGSGSLLSIPAGQASTSDAVPRTVLLPAIALNSVAYNAARAVGPALAGIMIAASGSAAVFLTNSLLFAAVVAIYTFLYRPPGRLPPQSEGVLGAIRSGIRYVQHAPPLRGNIYRTMLFVSCASALWALLPLVAKRLPDADIGAYGLLLASMGGGAVATGMLLGRLRARLSIDVMSSGASALFAGAMLVAAYVPRLPLLCVALVAGGAAWVSFTSITNAAFQTSLPSWVRARALAVMLLTFQGSMALGAAVWGAVAGAIGVSSALAVAAGLTLAGLWLIRRMPLRMGEENEVTPVHPMPELAMVGNLLPDDGPVSIQIRYLVDPGFHTPFCRQAYHLGATRRRNGASVWRLYRDAIDPNRYVERFIFASWAEYLRQRQRITVADRDAEDKLLQFLQAGSHPKVTHFVNQSFPQGE